MKKQLNVRISDATRSKLDTLTQRHGTTTEAVAVAIDRLYQDEDKENQMDIYIQYSEDSLCSGWNTDGIDVPASTARYKDLVEQTLRREYPNATVDVELSINDSTKVDGFTSTDAVVDIDAILEDIYQGQEWLVFVHFTGYAVALRAGLTLHATIHGGDTNVYASAEPQPNLTYTKQNLPPHHTDSFDLLTDLVTRMAEISSTWSVVAE